MRPGLLESTWSLKGLSHFVVEHRLNKLRCGACLKRIAVVQLVFGLTACHAHTNPSRWVRLPSSRGPDCTNPTWVRAGFKDLEFDRQTIYSRGDVVFVTVRALDRSFSQRIQVSCAQSAYRLVWVMPENLSGPPMDTISLPAWSPITEPWEQRLGRELCQRES